MNSRSWKSWNIPLLLFRPDGTAKCVGTWTVVPALTLTAKLPVMIQSHQLLFPRNTQPNWTLHTHFHLLDGNCLPAQLGPSWQGGCTQNRWTLQQGVFAPPPFSYIRPQCLETSLEIACSLCKQCPDWLLVKHGHWALDITAHLLCIGNTTTKPQCLLEGQASTLECAFFLVINLQSSTNSEKEVNVCAGIADFEDCLVLKPRNMQTIISACNLVIAHSGAIKNLWCSGF